MLRARERKKGSTNAHAATFSAGHKLTPFFLVGSCFRSDVAVLKIFIHSVGFSRRPRNAVWFSPALSL